MFLILNSPLLEFQAVSYTYPGATSPAIQNLNLSIPAGQKTVILGHNGCGKSTLFLLADGLYRCDAGTIAWRGEPLRYRSRALNQWRQRIGLVFQDPEQQLVAATVAEDLAYGLQNLELSPADIDSRLQETLDDFSLHDLADRPIHALSLGQKRRVALAGAIALKPQLLLLDEPTAYLDGRQTQQLLAELDRLQAGGMTIAIATHDLDFAYAWADWAIVIHAGERILADTAERVFTGGELLERLQLGRPKLLEFWSALPAPWRNRYPPPRTLAALKSYRWDEEL